MRRLSSITGLIAVALMCSHTVNAGPEAEQALISDGATLVSGADVAAYFSPLGSGGGPGKMRNPLNIDVAAEAIYISSALAEQGRAERGIDPQVEEWLGRDAVNRALARDQLNREIERRMLLVDWQAVTKEYFLANKDSFQEGEQVRASHILFATSGDQRLLDVMIAADQVRDLALRGGDFASLSEEHSTVAPSNPGGDLGFFRRGQMVPEFEEVAFSLQVGEVSDLVISRFGVHIIKVFERKPPDPVEFESVEGAIRLKLESDLRAHYRSEVMSEMSTRALLNRTPNYAQISEALGDSVRQ